jgi:hypothetical protein
VEVAAASIASSGGVLSFAGCGAAWDAAGMMTVLVDVAVRPAWSVATEEMVF